MKRTPVSQSSDVTLFAYMQCLIDALSARGQYRTSETYTATLRSFSAFRQGKDLPLNQIDAQLLLSYEYYLKARLLSLNTIAFYMKRLKAVYNRAVDEALVANTHPFKRVFISSEKTVKRALPLHFIKALKALDLSSSRSQNLARHLFLFSLYTRGMSLIDMAYLQKSNLKNGILTYRRKKTGQLLHIKWERCMQNIVDQYQTSAHSPYLLPIISSPQEAEARKEFRSVQAKLNRNLKAIGLMLRLPAPLTMYCARHSWASIAKSKGIPLSVISEGMGHDSEKTTQIYLASLETQVIDNANRQILKLL